MEEKRKRKAELEKEFHQRMANLPINRNTNRLDGGSPSSTDVLKWLREELKRLDQEFPD